MPDHQEEAVQEQQQQEQQPQVPPRKKLDPTKTTITEKYEDNN